MAQAAGDVTNTEAAPPLDLNFEAVTDVKLTFGRRFEVLGA